MTRAVRAGRHGRVVAHHLHSFAMSTIPPFPREPRPSSDDGLALGYGCGLSQMPSSRARGGWPRSVAYGPSSWAAVPDWSTARTDALLLNVCEHRTTAPTRMVRRPVNDAAARSPGALARSSAQARPLRIGPRSVLRDDPTGHDVELDLRDGRTLDGRRHGTHDRRVDGPPHQHRSRHPVADLLADARRAAGRSRIPSGGPTPISSTVQTAASACPFASSRVIWAGMAGTSVTSVPVELEGGQQLLVGGVSVDDHPDRVRIRIGRRVEDAMARVVRVGCELHDDRVLGTAQLGGGEARHRGHVAAAFADRLQALSGATHEDQEHLEPGGREQLLDGGREGLVARRRGQRVDRSPAARSRPSPRGDRPIARP